MNAFSSAAYWERRYQIGGTSGAGSYGRLARFKADFINALITRHGIRSIVDFGCGDGNLLSQLEVTDYLGVDVSATTLARCSAMFPQHRFMSFDALDTAVSAELAMSIDVVFHLTEDETFAAYMRALFSHATRFVLVYASNFEMAWPAPHVRHRRFSDHVAATEPGWNLLAHVPNPHPFDPQRPDDTSFADFFLYARAEGTVAPT